MLVELFESAHLPYDTEHQFAGTAGLGVGDGQYGWHIGIQMMVDEHAGRFGTDEGLLHILHTTGSVIVETEDKIGNLEKHIALLAVLVVAYDLFRVRQPQ